MVTITKECTACMACRNVCPAGAIGEKINPYGFRMPAIDRERCIACGLCEKVCPLGKEAETSALERPLKAYAAYHRSEKVVRASSSGGAFYALAARTLQQGGVVFGCYYDVKRKKAYLSNTDEVPLKKLLTSKYVESSIGYGFRRVKEYLDMGREVLFCGTPCQTAGLSCFLQRSYKNLLLVDFTCGAVTAQSYLGNYLRSLEKKFHSKAAAVSFRDKQYGWGQYCLTVRFENGKIYRKTAMSDPYFYCFLRSSMQRLSCHGCLFSDNHFSDIVLADFWKCRDFPVGQNGRKGISLALAMTKKGQKAIEAAGNEMHMEELDRAEASYNLRTRSCPPQKLPEIYAHQACAAKYGVAALRRCLLSPKERGYYAIRQFVMDHPRLAARFPDIVGMGQIMDSGKPQWQYGSLEEIAEALASPAVKIVSFDVFDTLLVRPTEREQDLFELLDKNFKEISRAQVSFCKLRTEAEAILRRKMTAKEILKEDISLDEIYEVLVERFGLSPEAADAMKQAEIETELRLCRCRESGAMLFRRAQSAGKKIILISDMYLGREQIAAMLDKHGYRGMAEIFISSEMGKRKITGRLYDAVAKELGENPAGIFHIGDNREADCVIAVRRGLKAAWLPKALDVYESYGCAHQVEKICADLTDWEAAKRSAGIGMMRALAAIKYFDDPFRPFEKTSDYNGDPYFVGYGALGMELLALVRWLADNASRDHRKKIIFMSRDGYLPMKAYEKYRAIYPELPEAQYLHISRLAVLPAMIQSKEDLFDLPMDISYQTPRKLLRLLAFCAKEDFGKDLPAAFSMDTPFTKDSYLEFIGDFIKNRYDFEKHQRAVAHIAKYLRKNDTAPLTDDAALFDMGYSGRIAAAIVSAADVHPQIYYFHADAREHFRHEKRMGRKIRTFFDFSPYMESSLREYSYLEPAASCIGYTKDLQPVYDAGPAKGYEKAVAAMQKGALDFVEDYIKDFAGFEQEAGFRCHEAAMPFEAFLRYCSPYDRKIYRHVLMDDELWGGRRDIDLQELMEIRLRKIPDYAKR